jgi:peptide-methionine (R)-S-oxide reductase
MKNFSSILFITLFIATGCNGQGKDLSKVHTDSADVKIQKSEEEWKTILTPQQYAIIRMKGTDRPFTGKYYLTSDDGVYHCAACNAVLFTSDMKFDSNCGWPSFDRAMEGGKIKTQVDHSHGMIRTEILCATCGGHLGHLFDDGPTETGLRYCVNSTSLNFVKGEKAAETKSK